VIVWFGDSISSNTVDSLYTPTQTKNHNFNVYNGGCYLPADPMLGCQINPANPASGVWAARAADLLIGAGAYQRVINVPIAVGGSLFKYWASLGIIGGPFAPTKRRLDTAGLTTTCVFCTLGANDSISGTDQATATRQLKSIIVNIIDAGLTCKIFISRHSTFGNVTSSGVQAAQAAVVDILLSLRRR
jgi:hypothetical protein